MASVEQTKAALATVQEPQSLQELVTKSAKELGKALPEHMRPERLVRIALTNVRMNPELGKCTPASFLGALFTAAQIGIEPVAGRAYILPFNNNRKVGGEWKQVKEAQFILGYKGVAELFYRHEKAVELSWSEVCEHDEFEYEYGTDAFLKHKPAIKMRGPVIAYYVVAKLQNGGKPFMVMSKDDCMDHGRKHSKTYDKKTGEFYGASPWATNPDAMCLKTVLIQLAKLLPLSVEVQRAIEADESSRDYRDGIGEALELPSTTNWKEDAIESPVESNGHGDIEFPDKKV